MSLITRESPFRWLDLMDDMTNVFLTHDERITMPIDLIDDGDQYVIEANLPGVSKSNISIDLNQAERFIEIKVNAPESTEDEKEKKKYLHRERFFGNIVRKIRFGKPISPENAKTTFENGVLTITIPKSEEAKNVKLLIN